jgi:WD40-like Beta Propeller Repeat
LSADGRHVAFQSIASNLVPGDTNQRDDVFVHHLATGVTRRVSLGAGGVQGNDGSHVPGVSAEGRYVVFTSAASNLVTGDTNNTGDVFVRDLRTGLTRRVNVASDGRQADAPPFWMPAISGNGRYMAFVSRASTPRAQPGRGRSGHFRPRPVARHHAPGQRQQRRGPRQWLARGTAGGDRSRPGGIRIQRLQPGPWGHQRHRRATNLVPGDTNGMSDIFAHIRPTTQFMPSPPAGTGTPTADHQAVGLGNPIRPGTPPVATPRRGTRTTARRRRVRRGRRTRPPRPGRGHANGDCPMDGVTDLA